LAEGAFALAACYEVGMPFRDPFDDAIDDAGRGWWRWVDGCLILLTVVSTVVGLSQCSHIL